MTTLALVSDCTAMPEPAQDMFSIFWELYPRRIAKKDARRMWDRIKPEAHPTILSALVEWRKIWAAKELEFVPYPATWLFGERWEDELPVACGSTHAAHVSAKLPLDVERTPMPESVRAALAKLRGKA